jgi:hypothetical protein
MPEGLFALHVVGQFAPRRGGFKEYCAGTLTFDLGGLLFALLGHGVTFFGRIHRVSPVSIRAGARWRLSAVNAQNSWLTMDAA